MRRCLLAAALIISVTGAARADTYWVCQNGTCIGRTEGTQAQGTGVGTYSHPIRDPLAGDLSVPVHKGMYCVDGLWHQGFLRPWERSPVIKPSCGAAAEELPQ